MAPQPLDRALVRTEQLPRVPQAMELLVMAPLAQGTRPRAQDTLHKVPLEQGTGALVGHRHIPVLLLHRSQHLAILPALQLRQNQLTDLQRQVARLGMVLAPSKAPLEVTALRRLVAEATGHNSQAR